jgi:hypothetical protein
VLQIGASDAFERDYMQRFRAFAGKFGEFITYERDRGARDLGLHLTHKLESGKERLSAALCWFQMKGIMASTLTAEQFKKRKSIPLSLDVNHLRYWFLQPTPTYLVVYIQSVEKFLISNIQSYIADQWGKSILTLNQKTATVEVATTSLLDDRAFYIILTKSDVEEWVRALDTDSESARLCRRDYDLIWHFGTADIREVEHRAIFWDWQSKMRGQFFVQEKSINSKWENLREHWQYGMNANELENTYPYLEFYNKDSLKIDNEDEDIYAPDILLNNGEMISGVNYYWEYFEYVFGAKLNELGRELFDSVLTLQQVGLLEITKDKREWISVAPWHSREV